MKRKILALACAAGLCLVASTSTQAAIMTPPTASFTVDGDTVNIPAESWSYYAPDDTWEFDGWAGNMPNGDYLDVQAGGKVDPMLVYTFAPIDFGAPSTFTFSFSMPIAATGPVNTVDASISGGLTDFTGNGISLTPNPALGNPDGNLGVEAQLGSAGPPTTNLGVDVGGAVAFGPGPAGANYTYGSYSAGPQPGPGGIFTTLSVVTSFTLSGGGDAASITGFVQIVPEPTSLAILALGGLALTRRSRRVV